MKSTFALMILVWVQITLAADRPPNVIIILTDDQGYNDLGCYGSPQIRTPRIDQMAAQGMRFTDFYSPAPVCTPTRAGLLTGCYPQRISMCIFPQERPNGDQGHVLFTQSRHGLNPSEITIAEMLKQRGYSTGMLGKWHLGDAPEFLPTKQGFDWYLGIPYSNDMPPHALMRDEKVIEQPVDQNTLTQRYTEAAVKFIKASKDKPFFLYFAHNMPHVPIHASEKFRGKSARGLYGDVIEELDWSTGQVLDALKEAGVDENTFVVFTSDNGPWHMRGEAGGSAFPLRAGKGTTYEGGMRIPCIMRWPGKIPAGKTCKEPLSHLDLLPTIAAITASSPPTDRTIDGKDISAIMMAKPDAKNPHEAFYYFADGSLMAVRSGKWKLKLPSTLKDETYYTKLETPDAKIPRALYDLELDPGEQKSVLADHPDVAKRLTELADHARADMGDVRRGITGKDVRPVGRLNCDPRKHADPTTAPAAKEGA
jgi:arylsulfatase A